MCKTFPATEILSRNTNNGTWHLIEVFPLLEFRKSFEKKSEPFLITPEGTWRKYLLSPSESHSERTIWHAYGYKHRSNIARQGNLREFNRQIKSSVDCFVKLNIWIFGRWLQPHLQIQPQFPGSYVVVCAKALPCLDLRLKMVCFFPEIGAVARTLCRNGNGEASKTGLERSGGMRSPI